MYAHSLEVFNKEHGASWANSSPPLGVQAALPLYHSTSVYDGSRDEIDAIYAYGQNNLHDGKNGQITTI